MNNELDSSGNREFECNVFPPPQYIYLLSWFAASHRDGLWFPRGTQGRDQDGEDLKKQLVE